MPGQSLCGWRICLLVVGALFVGINLFSLEGHAFHGVDSLVCFVVFLLCFRCLSQRRVGGSYALRVSPAVTRLTVYRRPQVYILEFIPSGMSIEALDICRDLWSKQY